MPHCCIAVSSRSGSTPPLRYLTSDVVWLGSKESLAIVPILPPSSQSAPPSAALGPGAIAGVVVAAVVAIAAALIIVLLTKGRSRRQWRPAADTPSSTLVNTDYTENKKANEEMAELHSDHLIGAEIMSSPVHELAEENMGHQLMSSQVYELPGDS